MEALLVSHSTVLVMEVFGKVGGANAQAGPIRLNLIFFPCYFQKE